MRLNTLLARNSTHPGRCHLNVCGSFINETLCLLFGVATAEAIVIDCQSGPKGVKIEEGEFGGIGWSGVARHAMSESMVPLYFWLS